MSLESKEIKKMLLEIATMFIEKRDELSKLDSLIGDGDHGISMARGAKYAYTQVYELSDDEPANEYFKVYGRALVKEIGGAIGPLFGIIFTEFGKGIKALNEFNKYSFVTSIDNATKKIMEFGGAKPGDKTMIDVMYPLSQHLKSLDLDEMSFKEVTLNAKVKAYQYLEDTKNMMAKKGRSKFLKEKTLGHQDAGATSFTYLIEKIDEFIWR